VPGLVPAAHACASGDGCNSEQAVHVAAAETGAQPSGPVSGNLSVQSIKVRGKPGPAAEDVGLITPGEETGARKTLRVGDRIASGSELIAPAGTQIVLLSSNGNTITLEPGSRVRIDTVSGKGESYTAKLGKMGFQVAKALSFFNVSHNGFLAAVRGTKYTVEVDPSKSLQIACTEGTVEVQHEGRIRINEHSDERDGVRVSERVSTKGNSIATYRLDSDGYVKKFDTMQGAVKFFEGQLKQALASRDQEHIKQAYYNLGAIYNTFGTSYKALEYLQQGQALADAQGDQKMGARFRNKIGGAYLNAGDFRKSVAAYQQALDMLKRLYPSGEHDDIAWSLNGLGNAYRDLAEDYHKSHDYHLKSLEMRMRIYPKQDNYGLVASLLNVGNDYMDIGKPEMAREYFERALNMAIRLAPGKNEPDVALLYQNLGAAFDALGDRGQGMKFAEASLSMRQRIFGKQDSDAIADSYRNIGWEYAGQKDFKAAAEYFTKALQIRKKLANGHDHPGVASAEDALAYAYVSIKDYERAFGYYEDALKMRLRLYPGMDHPDIGRSYQNLASVFGYLGNSRNLDYTNKSLELRLRIYPDGGHFSVADSYRAIGWVYLGRGQYKQAIENFESALASEFKWMNDDARAPVIELYEKLAESYEKSGDGVRAQSFRDKADAARTRWKAGGAADADQEAVWVLRKP